MDQIWFDRTKNRTQRTFGPAGGEASVLLALLLRLRLLRLARRRRAAAAVMVVGSAGRIILTA
jgi:hypothetical protein